MYEMHSFSTTMFKLILLFKEQNQISWLLCFLGLPWNTLTLIWWGHVEVQNCQVSLRTKKDYNLIWPSFLLPPTPSFHVSFKACRSNLMLTFNYTTGVSKQNFHCKYFVFCSLFDRCLHIQISSEFSGYLLPNLHRWKSFHWISQKLSNFCCLRKQCSREGQP